jgi:osmotically-inducible protein OsmY
MEKIARVSEMQKFRFGSKVFCSDGEYGVLTQVAFDAAAMRMTSIGVRTGRFFGKITYLPFDTVTTATSDGVMLRITLADVAMSSQAGVSGAVLDRRSVVEVQSGAGQGTLLLVAVHPEDGTLAYIVAHHLRAGQDTLLRREFVATLESGRVRLSIPAEKLQALPPYRSDDELQREVERVLYDLTPLHFDFPAIRMRVLDGVLYLDGNVSSVLRSDLIADQASGVEGLLEIKNRLVGDDALAAGLAMELGRDPRTRDLPIGVYPRLGAVRLSGAVHNEQQKAAATEIARNFPGVRSVVNDLIVDPKADMLHVMSSAAGGEAEDIVPGRYVRHTK